MKKIVSLIVLILTFAQHVHSQTKIGDLYYSFSGENATVEGDDAYGGMRYTNARYDIPSTVTYNGLSFNVIAIGRNAFGGFPDSYRGEGYASTASVIKLPITIKSIGYAAFFACKNIVSMIIPPNVTYIGKYAFSGCDLLRELIYTGSVAPDGWFSKAKTYVPDLQAYSSPTYPDSDARIIEMISFAKHEFEYTGEKPITTWTNNVEGYSVSLSMPSLNKDEGNHEVVIPATFTKGNESFTANIVYRYTIKPQKKTYTLSVRSVGNGSASYNGTTIKNNTQYFTLNEGSSATITFTPDNGYRIKSVKVNNTDVTSSVSNNQYIISNIKANTTVEVVFEAIPVTTYTLSIKATGSGYASYNGSSVVNNTRSFSVKEGLSAVVYFHPYYGSRIAKATMNGKEIMDLSSMSFTIDVMDEDVTIVVEFETIPTYTLTISATGSGHVTYNNKSVENETKTFSIMEGASAVVSFHPNEGYRIKSATMNGKEILDLSSMSFTIDVMDEDVKIAVEFESDSYSLTLKVTGFGYVSYNDIMVKNETKSFAVKEGLSAVVTFHPDEGCRIKSATINGKEIHNLSNMSFKIDVMDEDVTIEVEFEAIPLYTLTISASGSGHVTFDNNSIENSTQSFSIREGLSAIVEFHPDEGCRIKFLMINGKEIRNFSSMSFMIDVMDEDVTIEVVFEEMVDGMNVDGINYEVVSYDDYTVVVASGNYGQTLEVPETFTFKDDIWKVIGLKDGALDNCENLAAVIWNPMIVFNAKVNNPNLLLYVKDKASASLGIKNVIVNGMAESIELTDAANGNDFYCPIAFTAKKIAYSHDYNMKTGLGESKGWETIVLPFDVQKYISLKGEIVPFVKWTKSGSAKPFWLCELTASGYQEVDGIKANTPYIISMPNHEQYLSNYVITGMVTFSAEDVEVKVSDDMHSAKYQDRTFVPNYTNKAGDDYLALNVNNYYVTNPGTDIDGSKFIKGLRAVHPFEAYMTTTSNTRSIDVMDGMTTAIRDVVMTAESKDLIRVYDTRGILVKTVNDTDDLRKGLASGVYIVNGKKMIIK